MSKVLIAFALKEEFAPWRRRHHFQTVWVADHPVFTTRFGAIEANVVLTGAGARDASHFPALIDQISPSLGIVCGVAAGLKPEWRSGDMLVSLCVRMANGEEKIPSAPTFVDLAVQCGAKPASVLVSLPHIAGTVAEKARWAALGDAADMESFTVMKQFHDRGIPAVSLRVIVDSAEMAMPCDFEASLDARGRVRITRILSQLARRPKALPDFFRFAQLSRRATSLLARSLDSFMDRLDRKQLASATSGQLQKNYSD
jgi:nucleoside phosphorylase